MGRSRPPDAAQKPLYGQLYFLAWLGYDCDIAWAYLEKSFNHIEIS
jgi:hypothetical protein